MGIITCSSSLDDSTKAQQPLLMVTSSDMSVTQYLVAQGPTCERVGKADTWSMKSMPDFSKSATIETISLQVMYGSATQCYIPKLTAYWSLLRHGRQTQMDRSGKYNQSYISDILPKYSHLYGYGMANHLSIMRAV